MQIPQLDLSGRPWSPDSLSPGERERVAALAESLAQASRAGRPSQPLRGKNLAVLCEDATCPGLSRFCEAAAALGARVTRIRPSETLTSPTLQPTAALSALLGRLYDAIDCHGLPPAAVTDLARSTGKPVFNALGCDATRDATRDGGTERDRFFLQALLLNALA